VIITLCGSARFEKHFHVWDEILTLSGHAVFSLGVYPSQKGSKEWHTDQEKEILDKTHLKKIQASEAIFVLNAFAYIGESTLKEIEFARQKEKKLFALESWGRGNGIGSTHYRSHREAAIKYGVYGQMSPISTTFPGFREPWDILPEYDDKLRSKLVTLAETVE